MMEWIMGVTQLVVLLGVIAGMGAKLLGFSDVGDGIFGLCVPFVVVGAVCYGIDRHRRDRVRRG
jgi:hypothetical protein